MLQHRRTAVIAVVALLSSFTATMATSPTAGAATVLQVPSQYATITAAVAAAVDGDTIQVAPGTYTESPNFAGKDITLVSAAGASSTVIQPGSTPLEMGPNGSLSGFTVQGGHGSGPGGTLIVTGGGSLIRHNRFLGNNGSYGYGGSTIYGNAASPVIDGNWFEGNACDGDQQFVAGIISFFNASAPVLTNNVFLNNSCYSTVNLAWRESLTGRVENNTFVGGHNALRLRLATNGTPSWSIRNNVITEVEVGIWLDSSYVPAIDHNLVNASSARYLGLADQTGTNGNVSGDPLFLDQAGHDLRVQSTSPAVDGATAIEAPSSDYDGDARPVDGADADADAEYDIGAYERQGDEPAPTLQTGILDRGWSTDGVADIASRYRISTAPGGPGQLFTALYKVTDGNGPLRVSKYEPTAAKSPGWGGTSGYVLHAFAPGSGISFPYDLQVSGIREVVVGDFYTSTTSRLGVMRLRSDGSYDPAFSGDGRQLYKVFLGEYDDLIPFRMTMLSGGKIGLGVAAITYDQNGNGSLRGQVAMRLNNDGTLDKTFAGDGTLALANDINDVRFLPDGRLYVDRPSGRYEEVQRYRANGTLDPSFSGDGKAVIDCYATHYAWLAVDSSSRLTATCIRITFAGTVVTLARWNTAGTIDPTFAGGGKTSTTITGGSPDTLFSRTAADGRLYVGMISSSDTRTLLTWRWTKDGAVDTTYSGDGRATTLLPYVIDPYLITISGSRIYVVGSKDATNETVIALIG